MAFFLFILFTLQASYSATIRYSPGAGLGLNVLTDNLSSKYKLRTKTSYTPVIGFRALIFEGRYKLRTGLYGEIKTVSAKRTDPSLFDNDINASAWYGVIPINLQVNFTEDFYSYLGFAPHLLAIKSCDNDSSIPEGCGSFGEASTFVNYSMLGIGLSKSKVDFEINYQHALTPNYDRVWIHSVQFLVLKSI